MTKSLSEEIYSRLENKLDNSSNIDTIDIKDLLNELNIYEAELQAQNKELLSKEKELLVSREAYYELFQKAPTPFIVINKDLIIIHSNLAADEYFSLSSKTIDKISLQMFIEKNSIGNFISWILHKKYTNTPLVVQMVCNNSSYRYFLINGRKNKDKNAQIFLTLTDITEQKKLQLQVEEQKEEFETIFHYAQEGIAVTDLEGNFTMVNETMLEITGYSQNELLTKNCNELTAPKDKQKNIEAIQKVINEGRVTNFEKDCIVKDDKQISVNISISLLPNKQNILFLLKDISSLKLLEEQSRLASMGEMIGNIAHQWRQPLSIITTSISGLQYEAELGQEIPPSKIIEYSELVVSQAQYLSKTIDSFRNFLKGDNNHSNIKVKELFDYTFNLVEASLKNNYITLIKNIDESLFIYGNLNELTEALINIINNSKDILKENISDKEERLLFIDVYKDKDSLVTIEIKDNGGGIPDGIIGKVFEPYFTTKHQSIGTGLGLAMAQNIIKKRHNSDLFVTNKNFQYNKKYYKGACFKIVFFN